MSLSIFNIFKLINLIILIYIYLIRNKMIIIRTLISSQAILFSKLA